MDSFSQIWTRIEMFAGETFYQKRGKPFTYEVLQGHIKPSNTNRQLPRSHFARAHERAPLTGPGQLQDLQGPSYLYAILSDPRIRTPGKHSRTTPPPATQESSATLDNMPDRRDHEAQRQGVRQPDIVLVGCVKTKGREAAPARDLFRSDLFIKRRFYAEALRVPWYVLSAKFGLLHPDDVIGPYDVYLGNQPAAYRNAWGTWVAAQLQSLHDLNGQSIEIHAGEDYVAPLREPLHKAGTPLVTPLAGLRRGEQLAWYGPAHGDYQLSADPALSPTVDDLVACLTDREAALRPGELLERGPDGLQCPGLYSWWVDAEGAQELTAGLEHPVDPGLLYVGQASATRSRSGQPSSNTLWLRLTTMHLGGRAEMSTLHRTLAAALSPVLGLANEDDPQLSAWIARHMSVVAVPIQDVDTLAQTEAAILQGLDPAVQHPRAAPHTDTGSCETSP